MSDQAPEDLDTSAVLLVVAVVLADEKHPKPRLVQAHRGQLPSV